MELNDIINIEILQKIQDGFSDTFDLPTIIYDINGKSITKPSNFTEFCTLIRSTEKGISNCEKFDALLMKEIEGNTKPIFRKCCVLKNIIAVSIPIIVRNRHIANFGIGQIVEEDIDYDEINNYAKEINVDQNELIEASKTLISNNDSKLKSAVNFLSTISEQISYLATQNIEKNELIEKQKKIEQILQKQNDVYALLNEKFKITNNELLIAKQKAEESDLLKTEFIHNMSHEIRTPMNGILGFSSLLDDNNLSDQKRKHYINIIQNSGKQLLRIIDDILEISKLETKQVKLFEKEICLNDLFLDLFLTFEIKAKEYKIPLYLKNGLTDKESMVFTDKSKLFKILSNLLENALKFTNEGFIEFGYNLIQTDSGSKSLQVYVKDTKKTQNYSEEK